MRGNRVDFGLLGVPVSLPHEIRSRLGAAVSGERVERLGGEAAARVAADDQDRYLAGPRLRPGHELRPGRDVSQGTFLFPGVLQLSLVVLLGRERRLLVKERLRADVPEDDRDPDADA